MNEEITLAAFFVLALAGALKAIRSERRKASRYHAEARTDDLTGLGNKRAWRERTEELQEEGFAFVSFDVANLKAANEALGHEGANYILRKFASLIRSDEHIGMRVGGDEFLLAIPGCSLAGARALRNRIENQVGVHSLGGGLLVFIVGVAGECRPGDSLFDKLTDADMRVEARKQERKRRLGLPVTRIETLSLARHQSGAHGSGPQDRIQNHG